VLFSASANRELNIKTANFVAAWLAGCLPGCLAACLAACLACSSLQFGPETTWLTGWLARHLSPVRKTAWIKIVEKQLVL